MFYVGTIEDFAILFLFFMSPLNFNLSRLLEYLHKTFKRNMLSFQSLIPISKVDKDNENEETSKETTKSTKQSTDKPSSKYDTPCTLETEQCNLPYLVQAIQLWESAFNGDSKCKPGQTDKGVKLFDIGIHVDTMMTCGTRLISMRQVQYV